MIILGSVVRGKQEARGLGFPTANIAHGVDGLKSGVYIARMHVDGHVRRGLGIVGMWDQENGHRSLEVYLLDVHPDLYGKNVTVALYDKIRDLKQFDERDALIEQIKKDIAEAREYFKEG